MLMPVKSHISQERQSKIAVSKLPHFTPRSKRNVNTSQPKTITRKTPPSSSAFSDSNKSISLDSHIKENYTLTFLAPADVSSGVDLNANKLRSFPDTAPFACQKSTSLNKNTSEFGDENSEVNRERSSFYSTKSLLSKQFANTGYQQFKDIGDVIDRSETELQVLCLKPKNTAASSTQGNKSTSTTTAFVAECIGGGEKWKTVDNNNRTVLKQKLIVPLNKKIATHSLSNVMDYVEQITPNDKLSSDYSRFRRRKSNAIESNHSDVPSEGAHARRSRKFSAPVQPVIASSRRSSGKWSTDLDSAMNLIKRSTKSMKEDEISVSSNESADQIERKKSWEEVKQNAKPHVLESNNDCPQETTDSASVNGFSSQSPIKGTTPTEITSEQCLQIHQHPKILRPVTRPPRRRLQKFETTDKIQDDIAEKSQSTVPSQYLVNDENSDTDQYQLADANRRVGRRSSVPAALLSIETLNTAKYRQRRRISESGHLHQHIISAISEESGYSSNTMNSTPSTGESMADSVARWQERLRQNDRYREILENPNIVTFGQWRIKNEGNYAPEEKYGITERRAIRSSTDGSDSLSPLRVCENPLDESSNDSEAFEDRMTIENSQLTSGDDVSNISEEETASRDERRNVHHSTRLPRHSGEETNQNLYEVSASSSSSTTSFSAKTTPSHGLHSEPESFTAKLIARLCAKNPRLYSRLLKARAVNDLNESNGSIHQRDDLVSNVDEVLNEYEVLRLMLHNLYDNLNQEEEKMTKMVVENESLQTQNKGLNEKVNELTRLLEKKQAFVEENRTKQKPSMQDGESQTDRDAGKWFKTELSSVGIDLQQAMEHITTMKEIKNGFDEKISEAENKLLKILQEMKQNKQFTHRC